MRAQVALLAVPLLALAACGRSSGTTSLPPTLSQALAGEGALNAGGEDPFWALQIRGKSLAFSAADVSELRTDADGPAGNKNSAVWSGNGPDGRKLTVTIAAQPCHDAATGLSYPFTSEVKLGERSFHGCATRAGEGLGPHA